MMKSQVVLSLPEEDEIESTAEVRFPFIPGLIQKTIRYKNGMVVVLFQDFQGWVFSIYLNFAPAPFRLIGNQFFKIQPPPKKSD